MKTLTHTLLLTLTLLATLTACGPADEPQADADGKKQLIFISNQEHNARDPQRITWTQDIRLADCLFEPLVLADYTAMKLEPGTAEAWTVSEDLRTYTFTIRSDARWNNGEPVTAHDVAYAWQRAMLPDTTAGYAQLLFVIKGAHDFYDFRAAQAVAYAKADPSQRSAEDDYRKALEYFNQNVGIKTPDERTLVVTLTQPTPYFLDLAAFATFMPVHKKSIEAETTFVASTGQLSMDQRYWSDPDRLVTNGPYQLKQARFRQSNELTPNPHYWNRDAIKNSGVKEIIINDPGTALYSYQGGKAHYWPRVPSGTTAAELAANADNRNDVHLQTMAGTFFINANCEPHLSDGSDNPLADQRVRVALSMAIDRELIVNNVTRMHEPVAKTFIPPNAVAGYEPPAHAAPGYDPAAAKNLLAEAGYNDPATLTGLTLLYRSTDPGESLIAQTLSNMWQRKLGVTVKLEGLENRVVVERVINREYTLARGSWYGDYPDPTTWLDRLRKPVGKRANNASGWDHPPFDTLLNQAATERDTTQRLAMLRDAEAMMLEHQPMFFLYHYISLNLYDPARISGIQNNPWFRVRFQDVVVH
ncbi:peptide ABC transporter substrate-binding protein [Mucisphaera calidilacus]|uniref:Oligopeptide-binding protein OppA n=1 Tax=Mucisphaera calidilacus TaxID=2527982 RepID=A0A518BZ40_9BACT|nr:peptide ABC transporter substrate-binding protein [Mucisphaera calidilacus]QDU72241.1 Oligopeptide-binding protein OppA precursor [Mucisphaera calidilacus]